ncbi:enoyl-CoA hydratase [Candidatus Magnetomorum sp. HK-1]|nr:enoyl-CoA hydratase [Candidatus Magnetomorum sp. HK-1]
METQELLSKTDSHVGTLILNRPEKRNALSQTLLLNIHMTLRKWAESGDIWAVIITGSGDRAFSSGYDILSISTEIQPEIKELLKKKNPLELALEAIKTYPFPVIAMMNGYTFGAGLNLAMCCDIRIAIDTIKIGMPPAKLGLVYHPEGLKQFIEVLGMSKTKEIFFTARTYSGVQAKEMGIVDYLKPFDKLSDFTYALAKDIVSNAPLSLKGMKQIFNMLSAVDKTLTREQETEAKKIIVDAFNSEDIKEGQIAFIEKRSPCFKGQ